MLRLDLDMIYHHLTCNPLFKAAHLDQSSRRQKVSYNQIKKEQKIKKSKIEKEAENKVKECLGPRHFKQKT